MYIGENKVVIESESKFKGEKDVAKELESLGFFKDEAQSWNGPDAHLVYEGTGSVKEAKKMLSKTDSELRFKYQDNIETGVDILYATKA